MVGEAVQQCSGQALRSEHLGPFVEGEVGSHKDRSTLIALKEIVEGNPPPAIIIEAKALNVDLDGREAQLSGYARASTPDKGG